MKGFRKLQTAWGGNTGFRIGTAHGGAGLPGGRSQNGDTDREKKRPTLEHIPLFMRGWVSEPRAPMRFGVRVPPEITSL